ncbi:hypothetical protein QYS49_16435 [Marivirga salinae]|uniref:Lipocalin-like domain-containing protein n=1 Tax=Marivirga salinarum TaxID=3059078 RepID=A0AA49GA73_9BACT|nr:hypothetical protein [Marivirga sp. BDSF4-3]WKK73536.2 hypothetical protein QYS49_16435 [Marivirga sp. BDSF4-3]
MKQLFLIIILFFVALTACVDENDLKKNQSPIVGKWTYDTIEYDIKINNQNIYSYFDSLGLPAENIALINLLIESEIKSELEGLSIDFNADNSYEMINEDDEIESSGTYKLNSNQNEISLTDENNENFVLEILTLNENTLTLSLSEKIESPDEISILNGDLEADIIIYLFK